MRLASLVAVAALGAAILVLALRMGGSKEAPESAVVGTNAVAPPTAAGRSELEAPEPESDAGPASTSAESRIDAQKGPSSFGANASATLTLRVEDETTGQPVARFWVRRDATGAMESRGRAAVSDPDSGAVQLVAADWAGETGPVEFLVSSPLHAPATFALNPPVGSSSVETVRLARSSAIVGTVRDGASAPLAAARVTLSYLGDHPHPADSSSGVGDREAAFPEGYGGPTLRRTAEDGAFHFGQLPPGRFRISVERDGVTRLSGPLTVEPGRWTIADQWLDEHVRLSINVVDSEGAPTSGTRVLLLKLNEAFSTDLAAVEDAFSGESDVLPDGCQIAATRYTDGEGNAVLGPLQEGRYGAFVQSDAGTCLPAAVTVSASSPSLIERRFALED
ncbi:MAG: carboxypeptidase-like regulatory domain-containing protein [Planctomycetota bacterium]